MRCPLTKLRVLDFSTLLPGPFCSKILADFGAEVIKVESITGDFLRRVGRGANGKTSYFNILNTNKKSISINLKEKEGQGIILKLVEDSDILIESFRPSVMKGFGLDYARLKRINDRLIYCSLSGFGQRGEFRNEPGHDLTFKSLCGLLTLTHGKKQAFPLFPSGDILAALYAVIGILMAVIERNITRKGNFIDISIIDSLIASMPFEISDYLNNLDPSLSILHGSYACYNIYKTGDNKYLALAAIEQKFWKNFLAKIEKNEFFSYQYIPKEQKRMRDSLAKIFKSKSQSEWLKIFKGADTILSAVNTLSEAFYLKEIKSKNVIESNSRVFLKTPIKMGMRRTKYAKSPALGEDTGKILSNIGYSKQCIKEQKLRGIIS